MRMLMRMEMTPMMGKTVIPSVEARNGVLVSYGYHNLQSANTTPEDGTGKRVMELSKCNSVGFSLMDCTLMRTEKIAEACVREWNGVEWVWSCRWVRNPIGREGELIELTALTNFFVLNVLQEDSQRWVLDATDGRFTAKLLRGLINEKILPSTDGTQETKWNKAIPRKVCIMIW
ncbi:hypothetical protein Tco_0860245 [Tanacetum coccineum]|uniref:Uncharacterized protein n=1 Tax=Tanacetum coccineum TaxID=301880 RepID=A0ABQ5BI66_9ASTR